MGARGSRSAHGAAVAPIQPDVLGAQVQVAGRRRGVWVRQVCGGGAPSFNVLTAHRRPPLLYAIMEVTTARHPLRVHAPHCAYAGRGAGAVSPLPASGSLRGAGACAPTGGNVGAVGGIAPALASPSGGVGGPAPDPLPPALLTPCKPVGGWVGGWLAGHGAACVSTREAPEKRNACHVHSIRGVPQVAPAHAHAPPPVLRQLGRRGLPPQCLTRTACLGLRRQPGDRLAAWHTPTPT